MRRTTTLALGLALAGVAGPVAAQEAEVPVRLDVQVVRGMRSQGVIEPDCESIQRRLPMRFGTLRMLERRSVELRFGQSARLQLPTGRSIELQPISVVQNRLHVQFHLQGRVNTRLQLINGKPVIVGGEPDGDGAIIVQVTPDFRELLKARRQLERAPRPSGPRLLRVNTFRSAH